MIDTWNTKTVENVLSDESFSPPASGNWNFGHEVRTGKYPAGLISAAACAGLFMSSLAASADLLTHFPRSKDGVTVESVYQPIVHRRISIAAALRLSNEIIERAEAGRQKAANEEAGRAFDLELDS